MCTTSHRQHWWARLPDPRRRRQSGACKLIIIEKCPTGRISAPTWDRRPAWPRITTVSSPSLHQPKHHAPPPHAARRATHQQGAVHRRPRRRRLRRQGDMVYQGVLALMAMKTRGPVRLVFTRGSAHHHEQRHALPPTTDGAGAMAASAPIIKIVCRGGAYGMSTEGVMRREGCHPGRRALRHTEREIQYPWRLLPDNTPSAPSLVRGHCNRKFVRERISTSARKSFRLDSSESGASTPCATEPDAPGKVGFADLFALDAAKRRALGGRGATSRGRTRRPGRRACVPAHR